jgi:hypothetical protein
VTIFHLPRRHFLKIGASASFISSGLIGCGSGETYQKSDAAQWNETTLEAVKKGTLGPPMVARGLAMVHTAMYNAWAPYDSVALATIDGPVLRVTPPNKENYWQQLELDKKKSIAYAAFGTLVELYPAQKPFFEQSMKDRGYDPNNTTLDGSPEGIGNFAAKNVVAEYRTDGSNSRGDLSPSNPVPYADYTGYVPANTATQLNDPSRWQPQTFSNGRTPGFMAPHWGKVRTFAVANGSALAPTITLPAFSSKEYKDQVDEVLQLTANLTEEQIAIADYWADGPTSETPPGTWCMIANYVAQRDGHSLDKDVKMHFILSNALKDAAICCWETKRRFDSARPISAIRAMYAGQQVKGYLGAGKGLGLMAGETWMPFQASTFTTPPFAEFTSGHSTFSAASAEVLKRFTGSDNYGETYTVQPGKVAIDAAYPAQAVKLEWATFTAAAEQAGKSRLYGGIHFSNGNEYGKTMGRKVGTAAFDMASIYISGRKP